MEHDVEVWLERASQPIVREKSVAYVKGPFFCVMSEDGGTVEKYPIDHIFRIVEREAN